MEQKLTQAFDALHMDDSCASRIETAMTEPRRSPVRPMVRAAIATCLVLMLTLIAISPSTARAVEELAAKVKNYFSRTPGTIVLEEDYFYYNDGYHELESIPGRTTGTSLDLHSPRWLNEEDGRVYFVGDLQNLDITGQFSAEVPFIYTYESMGILHYIAVGGDYDSETGLDSIGYCEWLRRKDEMEEGLAIGVLHAGWMGGSSRFKYLDEPGTLFPIWYAKAVVELDIPWDNTEAKQQLESYKETK